VQPRRRQVEQRRELDPRRFRCDGVSEPDVDLNPHLRRPDASDALDSNAAVSLILADPANRDRLAIETYTVIRYVEPEYVEEHIADPFDVRRTMTEEIEVTRRTMRMAGPYDEERGPP
jgi:hypothetical protein